MDDIDYNEDATSRDHFVEDILRMLDRGSLNDVKIKLSDGEIFANKDILMARSKYFATMFSNKKFQEGETSLVDMSHCSKAVMEKIVKFLFSGGLNFDGFSLFHGLSLTQLLNMSNLSEMMLLTDFKLAVDDYIIDQLPHSADDVQSLFELISELKLADQNHHVSAKFMTQELHYGLKKIPGDVKCSDAFKALPLNLIKETFIDNDGFEAFLVWLSANEITEEEKVDIIENYFDFEEFTVEELLTFVRESGFYSDTDIDQRVLYLYKELKDRYYLSF